MKVYFISLGCDKNTVDSEMMLGLLTKEGHSIVTDIEEAEAAIINTCAFILDAKQESINTIIELGSHKDTGNLKYLIVTGCLAERYKDELKEQLPEVDVMIGTQGFDQIAATLSNLDKMSATDIFPALSEPAICGLHRVLNEPQHVAYLKIAEGCNKRCTYCAIPSFRGPYRSVPMEVLLKEAEELADRGVKELIVVAQETTIYGTDLYGEKKLPELLGKLAAIDGIEFIRILYCYPEEITDELIEVIKCEKKICKYLDMPIQSGSDKILNKMGRRTRGEELRGLIDKLRREIPDIAIRTTLIAGFPGEGRSEYKETLKFVEDMRFDRLGVFPYSQEEGTAAAGFKGQVPHFLRKKRADSIMKLQQGIIFEKNRTLIGSRCPAIIDGYLPSEGVYVGRTYRDAPDVDGYVFISSQRELMSGSIIDIVITDARDYDLIAEEVEDESAK